MQLCYPLSQYGRSESKDAYHKFPFFSVLDGPVVEIFGSSSCQQEVDQRLSTLFIVCEKLYVCHTIYSTVL